MNSTKCKNCGLKNFPSEIECRRCGFSFVIAPYKEKRPSRFTIWSLLPIALVLGVVYYFYNGVQGTVEKINANEVNRIASQPAERPAAPGLSRSKYDEKRSQNYRDAVKNSPALKAHEQRARDSEKAFQQASNSR